MTDPSAALREAMRYETDPAWSRLPVEPIPRPARFYWPEILCAVLAIACLAIAVTVGVSA
jgi:hypothetical protein